MRGVAIEKVTVDIAKARVEIAWPASTSQRIAVHKHINQLTRQGKRPDSLAEASNNREAIQQSNKTSDTKFNVCDNSTAAKRLNPATSYN